MRKIIKTALLVSLLAVLSLTLRNEYLLNNQIYAETEEEKLDRLKSEIDQYEQELKRLASEASTLSNQIAQYDAQIRLTGLKITETEEKIFLLGGRIDQLELSLDSLTDAFTSRAVQTYKMSKISSPYALLISADDLPDAFASYHYLQRIQEADRDLLGRLEKAQGDYKQEKSNQEDLQAELEKQVKVLGTQKDAKANLLTATKNDEKRYQQLLSEAKAQLAAFRRFVSGQGGASLLSNQTRCDGWGCYYNQRDSQWGLMALGGSSYSVAEYGCLVTSISMVASHYGKNIKPSDIAANSNYFVPGTGYLYHTAEGMPFSITSASKDKLDAQLASGPVIAGLFGGPDHFIVILRKDGDGYIMHDPFMPDGYERPLSDQYSVSDITTLRLVSFN